MGTLEIIKQIQSENVREAWPSPCSSNDSNVELLLEAVAASASADRACARTREGGRSRPLRGKRRGERSEKRNGRFWLGHCSRLGRLSRGNLRDTQRLAGARSGCVYVVCESATAVVVAAVVVVAVVGVGVDSFSCLHLGPEGRRGCGEKDGLESQQRMEDAVFDHVQR